MQLPSEYCTRCPLLGEYINLKKNIILQLLMGDFNKKQ